MVKIWTDFIEKKSLEVYLANVTVEIVKEILHKKLQKEAVYLTYFCNFPSRNMG